MLNTISKQIKDVFTLPKNKNKESNDDFIVVEGDEIYDIDNTNDNDSDIKLFSVTSPSVVQSTQKLNNMNDIHDIHSIHKINRTNKTNFQMEPLDLEFELNKEQETKDTTKIDKILEDVIVIKDISIHMGELLERQDKDIDLITNNIDKAQNEIKQADKEIDQALKYKKDGRNNVIAVTTGAIAGSFLGPLGAVGGAIICLSASVVCNKVLS